MKALPRLVFVIVVAFSWGRAAAADTKESNVTGRMKSQSKSSVTFESFVEDLKISGVFDGTPRRIYVDKRVISVGDVLHAALGVRLISVDLSARIVVFEDKTGARLSKRYP